MEIGIAIMATGVLAILAIMIVCGLFIAKAFKGISDAVDGIGDCFRGFSETASGLNKIYEECAESVRNFNENYEYSVHFDVEKKENS